MFSDLYLMTGPALVTRKDATFSTVDEMRGKEIAVIRGSSAALFLQRYPDIILRPYESVPDALTDLVDLVVDGAAIEILIAQSFVRDLFQERLKLASSALTDQGLRMMALADACPELIKAFDKGLMSMIKDGSYDKLLMKWGLSPDSPMEMSLLDAKIEAYIKAYL